MEIILTHSGNPFARGIRWFTRGAYSHAALRFPNQTVIEAVWPRVRELPFVSWAATMERGSYDIFTLDATQLDTALIYTYAHAQVGKSYDLVGDLHFVTRQDYATQPDDKWFCSELAFEACFATGIVLLARTRGWQVSPDLLSRSPLLTLPA